MKDDDSNEIEKPKRATKPDGPPPTQFSDLMATVSSGDFDALVTRKLRELIEACEETGGTGKLAVTIAIKRENRMMVVKPTIKATLPVKSVDADMFFIDEHARLQKDDPRQARLRFTAPKAERVIDLSTKKQPPKGGDITPDPKD